MRRAPRERRAGSILGHSALPRARERADHGGRACGTVACASERQATSIAAAVRPAAPQSAVIAVLVMPGYAMLTATPVPASCARRPCTLGFVP